MCFGGAPKDNGAAEARAREEARQASIRSGMSQIDNTFSGFNDDFFNTRAKAYTDYAAPQLEDQWSKARDELTYALSRSGLLNSSVAAEKLADATKQYNQQKQAIESMGLDYANTARGDVERNRSDIVAQLNATADPAAAAQAAANRATMLTAMPAFQPLGQLFQNVAANIGGQVEASRANDTANRVSLYGVGGNGSSRVVR